MKLFSFLSKPKTEIPITHQIGWWANQHLMQIDTFNVTIIKSKLNLMNSRSLLSYTIKGKLKAQGSHMPYIKKIHHSEKMLAEHPNGSFAPARVQDGVVDAEIQLTPIVVLKLHKKTAKKPALQTSEYIPFSLSNEFTVNSLHWGENIFRFVCGNFIEEIILWQHK